MPKRYTTTSRCVHLDDGTRLIVAIEPPRHITVWPDPWPVRVARRWRCRWLLLFRWWQRSPSGREK